MEWVFALLALTAMEIVLGIDNIVFITIVSGKLPPEQQPLARKLGLGLALVTRLLLLGALYWVVNGHALEYPVFELTQIGVPESLIEQMSAGDGAPEHVHVPPELQKEIDLEHFNQVNGVSWKDLILFFGGLFLVGKSVYEIHDEFGHTEEHVVTPSRSLFAGVLIQIALLDVVFSLDSRT